MSTNDRFKEALKRHGATCPEDPEALKRYQEARRRMMEDITPFWKDLDDYAEEISEEFICRV